MTEETKPKKSGKKKKKKKPQWRKDMEKWLALNLVPFIAEKWMRSFDHTALMFNERLLTLINHEEMLERVKSHENPSILSVWHNRLMYGPTAYMYCKGKGAYVMVSRSFDGEIIARTIARFNNLHAIRGSSANKPGQDKGGKEALSELIELGKQGYDLVITPDGPLGPRYQVKRGIIELAKATGYPIYPVAPNSNRYLTAKSWDKTRLPLPFSKFVYAAGDAIWVPADADDETIERKRAELEKSMLELTEMVDNFYKKQD